MTPSLITSAPIDSSPATSADSSISPEIRVSRPTRNVGLSLFSPARIYPPKRPNLNASSGVNSVLATPLTPSVPKYLPMNFSFSHFLL